MNWAVILVFGIAGAVLIASAAVAGSSAAFWYGMGKLMWADLWPAIRAYVLRRNDAETEERMRDCTLSGGKWDNFRKRCK